MSTGLPDLITMKVGMAVILLHKTVRIDWV
jgi:hypothetical protein